MQSINSGIAVLTDEVRDHVSASFPPEARQIIDAHPLETIMAVSIAVLLAICMCYRMCCCIIGRVGRVAKGRTVPRGARRVSTKYPGSAGAKRLRCARVKRGPHTQVDDIEQGDQGYRL